MSGTPGAILCGDGRKGHFVWGSVSGGGLAVVGGREGGGRGVAVTLEERVLQGVKWFDPGVRVIVQHPQDQILEFPVIPWSVPHLPLPDAPRPPRLHTQNVVQGPATRSTIVVLKSHTQTQMPCQ